MIEFLQVESTLWLGAGRPYALLDGLKGTSMQAVQGSSRRHTLSSPLSGQKIIF